MARPKGSRNIPKRHGKTMRTETENVENKTETENQKQSRATDNQQTEAGRLTVTPEQQAIISRAEAEMADWPTITEDMIHDYSLANMATDLDTNFPEAWKEQVEKRYAFRWCERTDKRIDELTRSGHPLTQWKLCTRTTTPFLAKYIDPIWGCVTRLDQVLLFRPWDRHMIEKRQKAGKAQAIDAAGKASSVAMRRAQDGIEAYEGEDFKIDGSKDEVQYEDSRSDTSEDFGDLVVES